MYAAAGGASLASRQARQRQRQKKAQAKAGKAPDILPKPKQIGQFSNYTDDSPTVVPPPRLSRVERNSLKPPAGGGERRHSTSNYQLKEPHRARLKESPSICIPVQQGHHQHAGGHHHQHHHQQQQQQHHHRHSSVHDLPPPLVPPPPKSPSTHLLPQIPIPEGDGALERRCSFVRQVEEEKEGKEDVLDKCNHLCNFEIKDKTWHENYEPEFFTEYDFFGSLDYPFSECSQGRAAWQERERGRRCSISDEARQHRLKQTEAHNRWRKRNRIHDTSYGGSSEDDEWSSSIAYHQSAAANALLYVGLGTFAIGSVIFFVGTGEKGFKTLELRLIGPTLVACGLLCCLVRVLLCACPSGCLRGRKKTRLKGGGERSGCTVPLTRRPPPASDAARHANNKKKVSIANPIPSTSRSVHQLQPQQLQQQQQQKLQPSSASHILPIIAVPPPDDDDDYYYCDGNDNDDVFVEEGSLIELDAFDGPSANHLDLQSVSSFESETVIEVEVQPKAESKHQRTREPAHRSAASPEAAAPPPGATKETHSGIVLSPLQLGQ